MHTISDEARRLIGVFEEETGATARDCVVDENDQAVFVVAVGEMGAAIGTDGGRVAALEDRLGRSVRLVEAADRAEDFVANALAPAAVYAVDIDSGVARVEVDEADAGVAIGTDGRTIEAARLLAERHFDIEDIELLEV